jgi:hypothetical protein
VQLCILFLSEQRNGAAVGTVTPNRSSAEALNQSGDCTMYRRPKYAQLKNVVFLDRIGDSLRWATSDVTQEELPEDIRFLLRLLDRLERKQELKKRA